MAKFSGARLWTVFVAPLVMALAAVMAVFIGAAPAAAQDDDVVAVVQIEQLRQASGADMVPIRVIVESRRALDAVLEVSVAQQNLTWQFPITIAANTEVQQTIAVPTSSFNLGQVTATLFSGSDELAEVRLNEGAANANAIGLLGVESPGAEVNLNPDIGRASVIELNDLRLLSALDSVVVSPAGVRALTPEEQRELVSWVWSGHQLVVADDPGALGELLPTFSEPGASELLGAGMVRYVGRNWDDNVPPGISVATVPSEELNGIFDDSNPELLNDAGFRVPGIGVLGLVLLIYLVIAGPVVFIVLSQRKRLTAAWVVIPALAAIFTVGIFAGSRIVNSGRQDAHAAIIEVNPVSALRNETFLVSRSGTQTIELPEQFAISASSSGDDFFGPGGRSVPITIRPSRTTTDLEMEIDPGSGGVAVVSGPADELASAVEIVNLNFSGTSLSGEVQNNSGEDLELVTVFVGSRQVSLGRVAQGESGEFTIDVTGREQRFGSELNDWGVDFERNFFNNRVEQNDEIGNGAANGTRWAIWRAAKLGTGVPDGLVTAVGWSRGFEGLRDDEGRTALVARAALPAADGPVTAAHLRELRLEVPAFNGFGGFEGGGSTEVIQLVRPSGTDVSELALSLGNEVAEIELWVDGEWRSVAAENDTASTVGIPDEAWQGNVLTARYQSGNFVDPSRRFAAVVARTDATDDVGLLAAGESAKRDVDGEDGFFEAEFGFGPSVAGGVVTIDTGFVQSPDEQQFFYDNEGFIEGTFDEWQIELAPDDRLVVEMQQLERGAPLDPLLHLVGPNGDLIAENDDSGDGLNSRIEITIDEPGLYTIETRSLNDGAPGPYAITVDVTRPGEG